jgi:hypothetical protein
VLPTGNLPEAGGYRSQRALDMKREGWSNDEIGAELQLPSDDVAYLIQLALASIPSESGDAMRTASELRILDVIRRAHSDLTVTSTQMQRTALLRLILDADARLSRLYGLEIPPGFPDAPDGA